MNAAIAIVRHNLKIFGGRYEQGSRQVKGDLCLRTHHRISAETIAIDGPNTIYITITNNSFQLLASTASLAVQLLSCKFNTSINPDSHPSNQSINQFLN